MTFAEKSQVITSANDAINDLIKATQKVYKQVIEAFLKENEDISYIMLTGYTPSFNDGEPCTFTMHAGFDEVPSEFEEKYPDIAGRMTDNGLSFYKNENWKAFNDLISSDLALHCFERTFNPYGFQATYHIEDGELVVNEYDYDCGY